MLYYIIDHIPPRPMFLLHIHLLPNHAISITSGWLWSDSCMYHIKAVAQTDYRACLTCSPKDLEKANVEKWSQYQHWCVPAPGGWHFVFGKPMTDCFCSGKTVISILHGIQHVITSVCLEKVYPRKMLTRYSLYLSKLHKSVTWNGSFGGINYIFFSIVVFYCTS